MCAARLARFASLGALVAMLLACESRVSLGSECTDEASCPEELTCRFGRCRAECTEARECTSGALCIGDPGVCTLVTDTCVDACAAGLVCAESRCTTRCDEEALCRAGSSCRAVGSVLACLPDDGADASLEVPDAGDARLEGPDAGLPRALPRRMCAGFAHACAIREDTRVYCWGLNQAGELGDGLDDTTPRDHPFPQCGDYDCAPAPMWPVRRREGPGSADLTDAVSLACGRLITCAVTGTGTVYCWGSTENGVELGFEGYGQIAQPAIRSGASEVFLGRAHGCARVGDHFECWGRNTTVFSEGSPEVETGALGSDGASTAAARRATRFDDARFLGLGGSHTCGVTDTAVRCVGANFAGEVGLMELGVDTMGRSIDGLVHPVEAIDAMGHSVCALAGGDVRCWGAYDQGILASSAAGIPECPWSYAPRCRATAAPVDREIGLESERFVGLSVGQSRTACVIAASDRSVLCWGANEWGQAASTSGAYGVDILAERVTLERDRSRLTDVVEVACGETLCCALTDAQDVYCWGENDVGQLGNGTTDSETADAAVPDAGVIAVGHPRAVEVVFP